MLQPLILLIVLIALNAVFASAEIAVISVNPSKLRKMSSEGDKRAEKLLKLTEQPARFLATIQVAITLAGLLQSAFAAENFAGPLVGLLISIGVTVSENILRTAAIIVITIILAYFTLVFGELVPKRIAMQKSESLALSMAGMLYAVSRIFAPLVALLTASTNGLIRLCGIDPDENSDAVTEEEIRMMLDEGNQQGTIGENENEMIHNIFELNDTTVDQICTHRRDIILLDSKQSDEEWKDIIKNNRHTFYPVCGKEQDDIIGILDTRDYFRTDDKTKDNLMNTAVKPPFCVPEGMKADVLFSKMKERKSYFAVIIDEYGCLSGVITVHDLLEELVGELTEPEEEETVPDIMSMSENAWQIQGCASLDDVAQKLHIELPTDDYDTFSGYICGLIGRVPNDGETFNCKTDKLDIEVITVEDYMVVAAVVRMRAAESE